MKTTLTTRAKSAVRLVPESGDVRDVLDAIARYEDESTACSNAVLDAETGLSSACVDGVLEYLWMKDMIECRASGLEGRDPSIADVRRVLADRARVWGPWGRYRGVGRVRL